MIGAGPRAGVLSSPNKNNDLDFAGWSCVKYTLGLVQERFHNVDALDYKIGANSPRESQAPTLVPHPPTPLRGWGRYFTQKIMALSGRLRSNVAVTVTCPTHHPGTLAYTQPCR